MSRILCAMSGGVDSSVAAALLRNAGHEVVGVFLRLGPAPGEENGAGGLRAHNQRSCCSVGDAHDASRVADHLGIPFYPLNYRREFERIIDYFVDEYNRGRTPNPCAMCNQWIKFGALVEQARALGCERVATGHYARVRRGGGAERGGSPELLRGADRLKDQSYFLFTMPRESLGMAVFPVGDRTKGDCRALARELGLPVADKPDSQEICFVPGGDYRAVLEARTPERIRPGVVLDPGGEVLGEHPGHQRFTIGQRRGLGRAFGEPRYVVAIDAAANTVTLGPRAALACAACEVGGINWLSIDAPAAGEAIDCEVQIRHRSGPVRARVTAGESAGARVDFAAPQDAVTPGQAAVFYRGEVLLGGGWIRSGS
jgi:tRNA-specific 2-thiouridylase